ncbi:hypothetical protein [Arthrobacter oryzae]|uniref:hypothetical protein n=1 Tax=Arthrobacter oryzae TaxID=409290 RepID=UPI0030C8FF3A
MQQVLLNVVGPGYGVIHRVEVSQGSWFADDDERRLAPAVVVRRASTMPPAARTWSPTPKVQLRSFGATSRRTFVAVRVKVIDAIRSNPFALEPAASRLRIILA